MRRGNGAQALLRAILAVSSDLDLHSILNQIVASACDVTHARCGFLGVLGENGELIDYVVHGLHRGRGQGDGRPAVRPRPDQANPHPLRLRGLGDHPEAYGFPANHPPARASSACRSGSATPSSATSTSARRPTATTFTNGDEARVDALARVAGLMIRNARRYAVSERRREWVEASAEIAESLHDATRIDETLSLIVDRRPSGVACRAGRGGAAYRRRLRGAGLLRRPVDHAARPARPVLRRDRRPSGESGELLTCRYDSDGTAVIVPLTAQLTDQGVMLAILERGRGRLLAEDRELVSSFVAHASLALDRAQAIVDRHELMLVDDRDRIARDLHDLVIQRLFATGLQLQGARRFTPSPEGQERIDTAVQELDQAIRDIRSTIYELQHGNDSTPRADLNNLIREYVDALGFTPQIRVIGALDSLVNRQLADQMLAVVPRGAVELRPPRRGPRLPGRGRGRQRLAAAPRHRQRPRA